MQLDEQERHLAQKEHEASIQRIVEEERQKLLKEHASKLLGYLPKVCTAILTCILYWLWYNAECVHMRITLYTDTTM